MSKLYIPNIFLKIGVMQDDLGDVVDKWSYGFFSFLDDDGEMDSFVNLDLDRRSLMIVGRSIDGMLDSEWVYNSIFSICSYSGELNEFLYEDFCKETGLEFREVPKALERVKDNIGLLFVEMIEGKGFFDGVKE